MQPTDDQTTPADGYYGDTDDTSEDMDLSFIDEAEKPEDTVASSFNDQTSDVTEQTDTLEKEAYAPDLETAADVSDDSLPNMPAQSTPETDDMTETTTDTLSPLANEAEESTDTDETTENAETSETDNSLATADLDQEHEDDTVVEIPSDETVFTDKDEIAAVDDDSDDELSDKPAVL